MATYDEIVTEFLQAQKKLDAYRTTAEDFAKRVKNELVTFMGCTPKELRLSYVGDKDDQLQQEPGEERLGHFVLLNRRNNTLRFELRLNLPDGGCLWTQMRVTTKGNVATISWGTDQQAQVVDGDMRDLCVKWTRSIRRSVVLNFGPPEEESSA